MQEHIRHRVLQIAHYMLASSATVRQAAGVYMVSKSTVHKDVTERLLEIDQELAAQIRRLLDLNKAERHIRGGEATRRKYRGAREKE
jgi:putative DeoR family transcriptional regulator (stage III sporulation protein D)